MSAEATPCPHPPNSVIFDILNGDCQTITRKPIAVNWCRKCGAYRCKYDGVYGQWRSPQMGK